MLHRNTVLRVLIFANFLFIFIILLVKKDLLKCQFTQLLLTPKNQTNYYDIKHKCIKKTHTDKKKNKSTANKKQHIIKNKISLFIN